MNRRSLPLSHTLNAGSSSKQKNGDQDDSSNSNSHESKELPPPSLNRSEINQLIMEYLVCEGYQDAAEKFSDETGIQMSSARTGLHSIQNRMKIREAVMDRRIEETISMLNEEWPDLLDKNAVVYFQLRQIQMLELIRDKEIEKALDFAQQYLSDLVDHELTKFGGKGDEIVEELENTMSLLAFENPSESMYGYLLERSYVEKIAGRLNRAILCEETNLHLKSNDSVYQTDDASIPRLTQMMAMLMFCKNAMLPSRKFDIKELWPTD